MKKKLHSEQHIVWQALVDANVFIEGNFVFASGLQATLKVEAERLYDHPIQLQTIIDIFISKPYVKNADVLLYVPNGMKQFMEMVGEKLNKPVAHIIKKPNSTERYEFMFASENDKKLAANAGCVLIGEDVVTTLGSVAAVRRLLPKQKEVHSLAILLRGKVDPKFQENLQDHYLLVKEIPTDRSLFRKMIESKSLD